jgi:hypothetical protein
VWFLLGEGGVARAFLHLLLCFFGYPQEYLRPIKCALADNMGDHRLAALADQRIAAAKSEDIPSRLSGKRQHLARIDVGSGSFRRSVIAGRDGARDAAVPGGCLMARSRQEKSKDGKPERGSQDEGHFLFLFISSPRKYRVISFSSVKQKYKTWEYQEI